MGSVKSWRCHLISGFEFPRLGVLRSHQDAAVGESARFFVSQFDPLEYTCCLKHF
jgi:hypothetical protein